MSDKISDERLDELIEGWGQTARTVVSLIRRPDGHDYEFSDNCGDTENALRELQLARKALAGVEAGTHVIVPREGWEKIGRIVESDHANPFYTVLRQTYRAMLLASAQAGTGDAGAGER